MNEATGKWSPKINDFEYVNLKFTAEAAHDSALLEAAQESKLEDLEIPLQGGSRLKWLKCFICKEMASDELKELIKNTPINERKEALLKFILDKLGDIPGVGSILEIIMPIVLWLIKRILKKAIDGWCQPCFEA